ncbi:MAG: T9SS type A sorting domain-containing protein [Cytophagales bacterium]|nr:T9SS type A sorting domain-containing protein [Bernardetiaceae bacterium]MDW8204292.1 T9SS type A sorting domain-containing protein [Cytophagales bacterium]
MIAWIWGSIPNAIAQNTFTTAGNWSNPANWSSSSVPTATENVIIAANCTVDVAAACNNLTVNPGFTLTVQGLNFTVNGNTRISSNASFVDNNNAGTTNFKGMVRVDSLASWTSTAVTTPANLVFEGGIISIAGPAATSFNAGAATFATSQNLFSRTFMNFVNSVVIGAGAIVNSQALVRIYGTLNGANAASTWQQKRWYRHHPAFGPFGTPDTKEAGGTLEYNNATQPMNTGDFDVNYFLSTVNYTRNSSPQTVRAVHYYNLGLFNGTNGATNPKTITVPAGELRVDGILTIYDARFIVAGSGRLKVVRSSIGRNGRFIYNSTDRNNAVGGFNTMDYYTGQFDHVDATGNTTLSSNNNTFTFSSSSREFTFMRGPGPGGVFAVKTTDFTTAPTFVIIQAEISTRTIGDYTNAAELMIGNGFTDDLTRHDPPTARLRFNLVNGNQFSITHPDGTSTTSANQSGTQTLTWVVNRSGAAQTYTAPDGTSEGVANNTVDVWLGTTKFVNDIAMANSGQAINDIKFVFDNGNSNNNVHGINNPNQSYITLRNLRIFTGNLPAGQIGGIVNRYAQVTAINTARTSFTVNSSTGFNPGDRILIIQMKGATIDATSPATNPNFGTITDYNSAGRYEFATVSTVPNATTIDIMAATTHTFDPAGRVQIVRVPSFTDVTVVAPLTAPPWNGTTGGVLALWVSGTLTLNSDIDVSCMGFRGGAVSTSNGSCRDATWATNNNQWGGKGEGIAETTFNRGRSKLTNGGGGGNPHNSGGGGGSNFGAGADGGRQWNCTGVPNDNGCADNPNGNPTSNNGGKGGQSLDYSAYRLFLGGGGGGGQQNNDVATPGGNGGGIVIIHGNTFVGNGYSIMANGQSVLAGAGGDSSGGGGGGGSILLIGPTYTTNIRLYASGGKGGDVEYSSCHGNGGGGGGGLVRLTVPLPPVMSIYNNGGVSSRNSNNSDCALQGNAYFCAEASGLGGALFENLTPFPVEISQFGAERSGEREARIYWTTVSERNHAGFEVQKSRDGIHFTTFSSIYGEGGDSFTTRHYEAFDQEPHYGANYYRLKQIDKDGTVSFSKIAVVYFDHRVINGARIFPNPTSQDQLYLRVEKTDAAVAVMGFDLAGRPIAVDAEKTALGEYRLHLRRQLPQGLYLFKIKVGTDEYVEKIVIQ